MIYSTNFDNDILVNEAVQELKDASFDYIIAKESGETNLSELAEIITEAEDKVENTKKLSILKRAQANIARMKKNKAIIEKYKDRALSADVSGLSVKVYDTSSTSVNKYIKACNAASAKFRAIIKKANGELSKEQVKELNNEIKSVIAERDKVIKEVESTTEKRSTVLNISQADVKKAISFIESGKAEKAVAKAAQDINNSAAANKNDIIKNQNGNPIQKRLVKYINSNNFMIASVKYMAAVHSADNARGIITTAAYASSKKNKEDE